MYRCILVIFCCFSLLSAQNFNEWKNYSSKLNSKGVTASQNKIWVATNGGAYSFTSEDSTYEQYTITEGLKSQNLTAVDADNLSQIWFGSENGIINVFNTETNSFNSILDINKSDASLKSIISLHSAGDSILALSEVGLSLLNAASLSFNDTYQNFADLPSGAQFNDAIKIGNLIYIATSIGLVVQKENANNLFLPESWERYLDNSNCKKITSYDGKILVIAGNSILQFNNGITQGFLFGTPAGPLIDMYVDGNTLYILSTNTVYSYSNSNLSSVYTFSGRNGQSLFVDNGIIYVSTNDGVLKISGGNAEKIAPNTPAGNTFFDLDTDLDGNLWCATGKNGSGKGVYKWDGNTWTIFNTQTDTALHSNDFHKINVANDNTIFFSNWGHGFTIYKDGIFTTYEATSKTGLIGEKDPKFIVIDDVVKDTKGNIWLLNEETTSYKPISVLTQDNIWIHYNCPITSEYLYVSDLVIDRYNTKWFISNTNGIGLYYFNDNGTLSNISDDIWGKATTAYGLNSNKLSSLVVDDRGEVWVGGTGIDIIRDPSKFGSSIVNPPFELRQLDNVAVTALAVDPLNQKWIGTTKGVFLYSPDGGKLLANYNTSNSPLPSNDINSIAIDKNSGMVYIGTDFGLSSLKTTSVESETTFSDLYAFPNPYVINQSNTQIVINGLIENSSIKILDVSGALVREIESPGGSVAEWDAKDKSGNYVSTGVYIIVAYDEEASDVATAKILVIKN